MKSKRIIKIGMILVIVCLVGNIVLASGIFTDQDIQNAINENAGSATLNATARGVWSFIKTALQFLSVGVIIFAGVRYMLASADQKADIKKSMGFLVLGAVIVFASTTFINFIVGVVRNLTT